MLAQEIWSAAADHDCVSFARNLVHDLLHHRHHAVGVEYLTAKGGGIALVTAAPEGFREAVQAAVHAFFAAHDCRALHVGEAGNFFGDEMVPELPAEVVGELSGDRGGAAAVLPLDGDETKHGLV